MFETEPMPVEGISPSGYGILGGPAPAGGKEGEVDKFRATRIAAGDSVSVALSEEGDIRVWGSFRVSGRGQVEKTALANISDLR